LNSAELYDPVAKTFATTTGNLTARLSHTATLLPAGTVLIAGGTLTNALATATTELFDPATGNFNLAANLSVARTQQVAAFLFNGTGLVTGGVTTAATPGDIFTP
jgi:hypothetical protein